MASATRPSSKSGVLGFADFKLDLRSGELHRNSSLVRLQRQPFEVLAHLAENAGEIVSRDELRQRLWPSDTFVDFDNGLNATINKVREALGDSADSPSFVETLPRRGYRFIAKVSVIAPNGFAQVATEQGETRNLDIVGSPRKPWLFIAAAGAALASLTVIGWRLRTKPVSPEVRPEQITTNAAEIAVTGSALSPDGKFLAYSDPTGTHVRVVATGETHTLAVPEGLALRPDAWLPDSATFMATDYADSRPGVPPSLWMVSVVGTSAFVNELKQTDVYLSGLEPGAKGASPPHRLTLSDSDDVPLAWKPDSRSVIFISDRSGYVNIYRQAIGGATAELIVGGRVNSWTPRVTPDGQHLVYLEIADATASHQATANGSHRGS